jgi:putative membrane protein
MVYGGSAIAVLLTGLARTLWGVRGTAWYWSNPLLHVKVTLPDESQIRTARKLVMVQAHILPFIPLAAVFLARGYGK